jgi:superfamily II DNA or RNA helicase
MSRAHESWTAADFQFVAENLEKKLPGFRKPQLAALHLALGSLITFDSSNSTMNLIMPTGTGKTDAIFAILIAAAMERTLILVPSDSLREQMGARLMSLEKLRAIGAIGEAVLSPNVYLMKGGIAEPEIELLQNFDVIIATPNSLHQLSDALLKRIVGLCSHMIIDEAHHVAAHTWRRVRESFDGKPVFQFTATPFRNDGQRLGGKTIYNYSLSQAQKDGYFQSIEFHPIREYDPRIADKAVADKALALLDDDLAKGFDHLLMVRAKTKKRAKALFELYKDRVDLSPVLLYSGVKNLDKTVEEVKAKEHRIIVCVDMLGEGFDLPELKIAALHDQHLSPAVTLQFIGRLTRVSNKLGPAKFVANLANQQIDQEMAALYSEDADWSSVIREVSEEKIARELDEEQFAAQFSQKPEEFDLLALNPTPKVSASAFKLEPNKWEPERIKAAVVAGEEVMYSNVNDDGNLVLVVTRAYRKVEWAKTREISQLVWTLYAAYYCESHKTLFVHCSGEDRQANTFLKLLAPNAARISGDPVFRILGGLSMLKLQNVGLSRMSDNLRFTMHVGRDINTVINELEQGTSTKSNIFAVGFDNGVQSTAGCSHKGKIWKMDSGSIQQWVKWCDQIAGRLADESINTAHILENVVRSEPIKDKWPQGVFFADWPDEVYIEDESRRYINVGENEYALIDLVIDLPKYVSETELSVVIFTEKSGSRVNVADVRLKLHGNDYNVSSGRAKFVFRNGSSVALSEYLLENPLRLLCVDGSVVFGNYRAFSKSLQNSKLPVGSLIEWDWGTTPINVESMGRNANLATVQGFTYLTIKEKYSIVFNDDGAGEVADLVCINESKNTIEVDLYHCKYCSNNAGPGARVADTYEVSGQASRSVKWNNNGNALFERLLQRYQDGLADGFNRLLKGDNRELDLLRNKCRDKRVVLRFNIVQPAIARSKVSEEQLRVLGSSYAFIKATTGQELKVIVNKK